MHSLRDFDPERLRNPGGGAIGGPMGLYGHSGQREHSDGPSESLMRIAPVACRWEWMSVPLNGAGLPCLRDKNINLSDLMTVCQSRPQQVAWPFSNRIVRLQCGPLPPGTGRRPPAALLLQLINFIIYQLQ